MSIDLKVLGTMFKEKREEMHLSIKEIENATSIRMTYLQAIEEGMIDKYISPVYALGFIKQYASFLGLDEEKLLKDNAKAFSMNSKAPEFDYGLGTIEVRNTHGITKKRSNFVWLGVSLGILILAWFFAKSTGIFW